MKEKKRKQPDFFISGLDAFRMYTKGDYKIVRMNYGTWELYNIKEDPTEINNIADKYPEILDKMVKEYQIIDKIYLKRK